jgi:hypothetical protein
MSVFFSAISEMSAAGTHNIHVNPNPPSFLYPLLPLSPYQLNISLQCGIKLTYLSTGIFILFTIFYRVLSPNFKRSAVRRSLSRGNSGDIYTYIVGSGCFAAVCVISQSGSRVI